MKIFALAPNEDWICDRFVKEWNDENQFHVTKNVLEASIVWLVADWCWNRISREVLSSKKVVATVHHIVLEKFTEEKRAAFVDRDQFVDLYHVPCQKTKEQLEKLSDKPIWIQPFWVNHRIWRSISESDVNAVRKQMGLDDTHVLIGSFQRDTEGHDLVSPKLEKGPDLFCDAIETLAQHHARDNKEVRVLLAGWRRQYVMKRLSDAGIVYYYIELPDFETVNLLYNVLDLYVVAARCEGGPQAVVECAATKTPVVSTDVGLASKFLAPESIFTPGNILDASPNVEFAYNKVEHNFMPKGFEPFNNLFLGL
jgi:glycosyltransferase involved in cell wall biosynthesis